MKKLNILIVDDDRHLGETTAQGLRATLGDSVHVDVCFNSDNAFAFFKKRMYDVVISDYNMPGTSGLDLLTQISANYPESILIMMTAYGTDKLESEARKVAEAYITKPFELSVLVRFIRDLIKPKSELSEQLDPNRILLLEDDKHLRRLISKVLKNSGFEIFESSTIAEARNLIDTNSFDVFVSDVQVPDGLGIELVAEQRDKLTNDDTVIIMVTGEARYRYQEDELGIDMYLEKPIALQDLVTLVQRLTQAKIRA